MPSKVTRSNRQKKHKKGDSGKTRKAKRGNSHMQCVVHKLKDGNLVLKHGGDTYQTRYFHVCPSSTARLLELHRSQPKGGHAHRGADCPCFKFAKMEDKFLGLEVKALCHHLKHGKCHIGRQSFDRMRKIHREMLSKFGKEMLGHHRTHLTTAMRCTGDSMATRMSPRELRCPTASMRGGAGAGEGADAGAAGVDQLQAKFRDDVSQFQNKVQGNRDNQKIVSDAFSDVFSTASAYLSAIKDDKAMEDKQRNYRYMCLKTEVEGFMMKNRLVWARLKQDARVPLTSGLESIKQEINRVLGADKVLSNACSLIGKASAVSRPVDVDAAAAASSPSVAPAPTGDSSASAATSAATPAASPPSASSTNVPDILPSWNNPEMTKIAQQSMKKDMEDMISFDDDEEEQQQGQPQEAAKEQGPQEQAAPSVDDSTPPASATDASSTPDTGASASTEAPTTDETQGSDDAGEQIGPKETDEAKPDEGADDGSPTAEATPEGSADDGSEGTNAADEDNCKVRNIEPNTLPCPGPGETAQYTAIRQELSPEANAGCEQKATELLEEFNKRCPEPTSQDEQEEGTKPEPVDDDRAKEEGSVAAAAAMSSGDDSVGTGTEATPQMGVTTSTTTTPHDGYNEIHIVVRVPQDYPQTATGTAGTTFENALQSITNPKRGGGSSRVTPKRHRSYQSSILRRKTMPKRRH